MSVRNVDREGKAYGECETKEVYVKWASDQRRIAQLAHEANLYNGSLKSLQGKVVPHCYGFFTDHTDSPSLCLLVLERCTGTYPVENDEV